MVLGLSKPRGISHLLETNRGEIPLLHSSLCVLAWGLLCCSLKPGSCQQEPQQDSL